MIGLEFIAKTFKMEYKQIAEEIGVSPATIQDWLKGRRKVPQKRSEQLSKMFNLPSDYFGRVLTNSEQLKIQILELEKNDVGHEVPFTDETGNEVGTTLWYENEGIIRHLREEADRLEVIKKLTNKIETIMANEDVDPSDWGNTTSYDVFASVSRILTKYKYEQRQALEVILHMIDLDNHQVEEDILLGFYSTEFISRYVPSGMEEFTEDVLKLFFKHGILEKSILKKYIEKNDKSE